MIKELSNISWDEIESVELVEDEDCYDISLLEDDCWQGEGNFLVDDIVVHNCGMHEAYVKRKKGLEPFEIHPLMEPILGKTYGVMAFQEQVMRILNVVGGIPLTQCEKLRKAISKKDEKKFKSAKAIFILNGQKKLGWDEEKVSALWDQIQSFAEYGFNKSHAVSYSYISSRLLYLKAHYPLEFFAGTLAAEDDADKIKEYKLEAKKNGVEVKPIDINKSGWNFKIVDDAIYMGFSNLKGVGEDSAQKIVKNQPYSSFEDFLTRFGTEAKVVKPVVALGLFGKENRINFYEFYEYFKEEIKRREDRNKRALKTLEGVVDELRFLLPEECAKKAEEIVKILDAEVSEEAKKVIKKYNSRLSALVKKQSEDKPLLMSDYLMTGELADREMRELLSALPQAAEEKFYGFSWDHVLEHSPDYDGDMTFEQFDDENKVIVCCEVQVKKAAEKKTSKKGKAYYIMRVEDANGRMANVTIWEEDFLRFKEELEFFDKTKESGHLLKIRLERPGAGFSSFTFESPPRHLRKHKIPEDKAQDYRLMIMQWPQLNN